MEIFFLKKIANITILNNAIFNCELEQTETNIIYNSKIIGKIILPFTFLEKKKETQLFINSSFEIIDFDGFNIFNKDMSNEENLTLTFYGINILKNYFLIKKKF